MKRTLLGALGGVAALAAVASSCSPSDFQSETVIDTVRVLATRASEPRAKPGDTVTVDLLAYDGRQNPATPMKLSWLPILCVNPQADAYYACFAQFVSGGAVYAPPGDAGGGGFAGVGADPGGLAALLTPGVDLTPLLASGPSFTFQMPSNAIIDRTGVSPSYGLVILFNFACAGHIEVVPFDPNSGNPQDIPLSCFDDNHNQVPPSDYVIGFTRVYAYADSTEVNPTITSVDLGGTTLAIDGGVTTAPFTPPICDQNNCPHHPIGPVVPPSAPPGKVVWFDAYSTIGTFTDESRSLYNPMATFDIPAGTNTNFLSPTNIMGAPAQNFVWIVVHDNQGGADWVTVPLQVQQDASAD